MANINRFPAVLDSLDTVYVFDDFTGDQTDLFAVDTVSDTGTALVGDDVNGVITLTPSDGTVADNDEVYLATPNEIFKFGTNRELYARFRIKFTETSAGVGSVCVGFQNAVGADSIVDNTGLPKTSGSFLGIYKTDADTYWKCGSAVNGTATATTSTKTSTSTGWQVLEVACKDWDGVTMMATFKVDGEYLKDSNGVVIRHAVPIASATEMQMFVGKKLGAATNNDTLLLDYWYGAQTRV